MWNLGKRYFQTLESAQCSLKHRWAADLSGTMIGVHPVDVLTVLTMPTCVLLYNMEYTNPVLHHFPHYILLGYIIYWRYIQIYIQIYNIHIYIPHSRRTPRTPCIKSLCPIGNHVWSHWDHQPRLRTCWRHCGSCGAPLGAFPPWWGGTSSHPIQFSHGFPCEVYIRYISTEGPIRSPLVPEVRLQPPPLPPLSEPAVQELLAASPYPGGVQRYGYSKPRFGVDFTIFIGHVHTPHPQFF
jgi:hypothetical protein